MSQSFVVVHVFSLCSSIWVEGVSEATPFIDSDDVPSLAAIQQWSVSDVAKCCFRFAYGETKVSCNAEEKRRGRINQSLICVSLQRIRLHVCASNILSRFCVRFDGCREALGCAPRKDKYLMSQLFLQQKGPWREWIAQRF